MSLEKISISPSDYVVLDVETNGLRSKEHDLLSLSMYKPDDGKIFDRLFPLDLNTTIPREITAINGIKKQHLRGKEHLKQCEFDELVSAFELERRTILHYGATDERFVRDYLARQGIEGFEKLHFFNFKKRIFSSKFSNGTITKDNLCAMFGIAGVRETHSSLNDCKLEWELFKKMDGDCLLVTRGFLGDEVFRMSNDYIVPVSYLATYPNLSRAFERPYIVQESEIVYRFTIKTKELIERFGANISGVTIEHLLNTMLDAEKVDSADFLLENKKKVPFLGLIRSSHDTIPVSLNSDGTVSAHREEDKELEERINRTNKLLRFQLQSAIEFIKKDIFENRPIKSQELCVDYDVGILALCDLSTDRAVLEIKTGKPDPGLYAEQLYYEARGRDAYLLCFEWDSSNKVLSRNFATLDLIIFRVHPTIGVKRNKRRDNTIAKLNLKLTKINAEVDEFVSSSKPVILRCLVCNQTWSESYNRINQGRAACAICHPETAIRERSKEPKAVVTPEEKRRRRIDRYVNKVSQRSGSILVIDRSSYLGSKAPVAVQCSICGHRWTTRADHLLSRCFCPKCKAS